MNNGLINTSAGTIHNAYAIKHNAHSITNQVTNGVQSGELTSQEHQDIHAERQANGQQLAADKQAGPVTAQERAALRSSQDDIMAQINSFESGACPAAPACPPPPPPTPSC